MFSILSSWSRPSKHEPEVPDAALSEEQLQSSLAKLCGLPAVQPGHSLQRVADDRVERLRHLLLVLDNKYGREGWMRWSDRPRTFIILWNLDALDFMDKFVERNFTDIWLPYDNRTLPDFIRSKDTRQQFLIVQNQLLTDVKVLEKLSNQSPPTKVLPHIFLEGSGDQHFRRISSLGQGGFGAVDEVWSNLSLTRYARKRVLRGRQSSEPNRRAQNYLVKELEDLKSLSHRHLVKVLGSYTDKEYIAFLMQPVAECNLHDFLTKHGGLTDRDRHDIRRFYGCLAGAVHYLHSSNIRHRDLSSRNILIYQGSVYISDLGSAYKWAGTSHGSVTQDRHVPTSLEYMAPEVAKRAPRSSSSDMWSLGVVFLEMTTLLVGQTLQQLQTAIERNARSRNLEPYIWANPRVVSVWVNELQQSNIGPRHDNEPLVWIRDLLDEFPNNRPKSRGLMQDILECPSFSIFCCIKCQPDFRERRFGYSNMRPISEEPLDDSTNIRNTITSMLEDGVARPAAMSVKKTSSIQTWLADTDFGPAHWEQPLMPGSFGFGDFNDLRAGASPPTSEASYSSAIDDNIFTYTQLAPPPPLPAFELSGDTQSPSPSVEPAELLGDVEFSLDLLDIDPLPPLRSAPSRRVKDTGLGFFEYDSSSSSDSDEEIKLFNEVEDSSGSESDSDATILPSKGVEGNIDEPTLPSLIGKENNLIQALDALREGQEDDDFPHSPSKKEVVVEFEEISDDSEEENNCIEPDERSGSDEEKDDEEEERQDKGISSLSANTSGEAMIELEGGEGADLLDESDSNKDSALLLAQSGRNSPVTGNAGLELESCNAAETFTADPLQIEISDEKDITMSSSHQSNRPEAMEISTTDGTSPIDVQLVETVPTLTGSDDVVMQPEQPISHHIREHSLQEVEAPDETRSSSYFHGKDYPSETYPPSKEITIEADASASIHSSAPPHEHVLPDTVQDLPVAEEETTPIKPSSIVVPEPSTAQAVGPQVRSPDKVRFKSGTSLTRVDEPQNKHLAANAVSFDDGLPDPKTFERKKRALVPGISARDYINDTWESASSVATSVMSQGTLKMFRELSLNKWLDRDQRLLELFCAKGNVEAVRLLLRKGCNPGRAEGSKKGRRIGPIMNAVQGASLKHNKCVKELINYEVDVNVINRKTGKTPLHVAIENHYFKGYEHLIRDLIEAGADTNKADVKDDRPIMKIFYGNDTGPLEDYRRRALALLLRDADTEVDIILPGTLNTPLHLAVRRKDPYAVGMLLYKKADVNAKNASGTTPLLLTANQFSGAMTNDHTVLLELLLDTDGINVNETTGVNEQTALHYAVGAGTSAAVELLLAHGANPQCKDSKGRNALALAIQHAAKHSVDEHIEIMMLLRDAMGQEWPRKEGTCVLEMACKLSDSTLMQTLLNEGLDSKMKKNNQPILQRAIGYGNEAVVTLLTAHGAVVDVKNENGMDAVAFAVHVGKNDIARYLVKEGRYLKEGNRMSQEKLEEIITKAALKN